MLVRAAQSSLPALERMLVQRSFWNQAGLFELRPEGDAPFVSPEVGGISEEELHDLQALLDEMDNISTDTKLGVLLAWIRDLRFRQPHRLICTCSQFVPTVRYLETALKEYHGDTVALTGDMSTEEKSEALRSFGEGRGILVTTLAALEGLQIKADTVAFYDMPWNAHAMAVALMRVRSSTAPERCEAVALKDNSGAFTQGSRGLLPQSQL